MKSLALALIGLMLSAVGSAQEGPSGVPEVTSERSAAVRSAEATRALERYIQAVGGGEAWDAARALRMRGRLVFGSGYEAPVTLTFQRPNSLRIEMVVEGKSIVQAFDGKTAWQLLPLHAILSPPDGLPPQVGAESAEPGDSLIEEPASAQPNPTSASTVSTEPELPKPQTFSGKAASRLQELAEFGGPLLNSYAGEHLVEVIDPPSGSEGLVALRLTRTKSGRQRTFVLDPATYLPRYSREEREIDGVRREVETRYSDYREVGALVLPFGMETVVVGGDLLEDLQIFAVALDPPLPGTPFTMPVVDEF